jgi:hypothetical protein
MFWLGGHLKAAAWVRLYLIIQQETASAKMKTDTICTIMVQLWSYRQSRIDLNQKRPGHQYGSVIFMSRRPVQAQCHVSAKIQMYMPTNTCQHVLC